MPAETFIMFLLRGHYASPIDYTDDALEQAGRRVRDAAREPAARRRGRRSHPDHAAAVQEALDDDFNTPRALALLFEAPAAAHDSIVEVLEVLGLGGLAREPRGSGRGRRAGRAAGGGASGAGLRPNQTGCAT